MVGENCRVVYIIRVNIDVNKLNKQQKVGEKNVWGWVCDWAEAGSEQGEEGVGKKVESKF